MADRIDSILRDCFSGRLDLKIKQREYVIRNDRGPSDENIGGGKALNRHNRPVEDMRIHIDEDRYLSRLNKQKEDIDRWIATFEPEKHKVVRHYYASQSVLGLR